MFRVCATRCDQCLFGEHPIVTPEARKSIIRGLAAEDQHFVCHKFTIAEGPGSGVCCRGDYDRDPYRTNTMRVMARLGFVRFVDLPREEREP